MRDDLSASTVAMFGPSDWGHEWGYREPGMGRWPEWNWQLLVNYTNITDVTVRLFTYPGKGIGQGKEALYIYRYPLPLPLTFTRVRVNPLCG